MPPSQGKNTCGTFSQRGIEPVDSELRHSPRVSRCDTSLSSNDSSIFLRGTATPSPPPPPPPVPPLPTLKKTCRPSSVSANAARGCKCCNKPRGIFQDPQRKKRKSQPEEEHVRGRSMRTGSNFTQHSFHLVAEKRPPPLLSVRLFAEILWFPPKQQIHPNPPLS